jgi:eukaryotic-like serine/threonine-protein kinase
VFKRSLLFNLLLVGLIIAGLLYGFFASLNYLTNHGQETKVPDLSGKLMPEALQILKKQGFKIKLDSTYRSYETPLKVLFQEPSVGSTVKVGRTIFLTINRLTPPSIPMPNLVNISFRNAVLQMQSYRLVMGDTTFRPDVAAGAVLEQWCNGKPILAGQLVPIGSQIDLVVGEGLSDMQDVPNFIGMTWNDARAFLQSHNLIANPVFEGAILDSNTAIVFAQQPEALNELDFKNAIMSGDIMDVRIMQNPSAELLKSNLPGSRKLLGEDTRPLDSNGNPIEDKPYIETPISVPTPTDSASAASLKPKRVPGVNVPGAANEKPLEPRRQRKNIEPSSNKLTNPNLSNANVSTRNSSEPNTKLSAKTKPRKPKLPKNGTQIPNKNGAKKDDKPKQAPLRKSDDNIKNEFE